ncbi:SsrA-binding protein SmpB [Lichenibacterium ramalinae]|uniref:SsrA-binding protein n=1 Tax=Lichenibacterium ramalinae TaxID=2316527 RepID=A0A4Q2RAL2_9HYPH|nr:SsrA-binding protein SmpB [Lichenibacterium ramalinae]RYB03374.1 SsrA-binding protein SmpB [Lichenibacterium ramalinae]
MAKNETNFKVVSDNRRARYNYEIGDVYEAGLVLTGTEVKSLRSGKATIAESYASAEKGEIFLINATIPEYGHGNRFNHEPKRPRKILLKSREIARLTQGIEREGMTLVPLKVYFNEKGRAKLTLAIGRGKKLHDKRATEKERDWNREKSRLMRDKGRE